MFTTWLHTLKLDEEKSNHAGLALQDGFCPICFHLWKKSIIKNDLIAAPCFQLANHNDWSRWFAISSLPSICSMFSPLREDFNKNDPIGAPCFQLANHNDGLGGLLLVVSKLFAVPLSKTKLERFCRVAYWVLLGMLLGGHLARGLAWKPKTIPELIKRLKGVLMKIPGSLVFSLSSIGDLLSKGSKIISLEEIHPHPICQAL